MSDSDWGDLFYSISAYSWAYVGIGIALGASVVGAAWYYFVIYLGESLSQELAFSELLSKLLVLDLRIWLGKSKIIKRYFLLSRCYLWCYYGNYSSRKSELIFRNSNRRNDVRWIFFILDRNFCWFF